MDTEDLEVIIKAVQTCVLAIAYANPPLISIAPGEPTMLEMWAALEQIRIKLESS